MALLNNNEPHGVSRGIFQRIRAGGRIFLMAPERDNIVSGNRVYIAEIMMGNSQAEQEANSTLMMASKDLAIALSRILGNVYNNINLRDRQEAEQALMRSQGRIP